MITRVSTTQLEESWVDHRSFKSLSNLRKLSGILLTITGTEPWKLPLQTIASIRIIESEDDTDGAGGDEDDEEDMG